MRNLDKIFKVVAFLLLLLLSITSKAQVPLYQLEYAPDSNYVIGANVAGEPIWKLRSLVGGITGVSPRIPFFTSTTTLGTSANFYWDNTYNEMAIKDRLFGSNATGQLYIGYLAGDAATSATHSNFLSDRAGQLATNATQSNFFGYRSGYQATNASNSNFLGYEAGQQATNAAHSTFMGYKAGRGATDAKYSFFAGDSTGMAATGAEYSNFIGLRAGYNASNAYWSNFFGRDAGSGATQAFYSNFIGYKSGSGALLSYGSNFIGYLAGYGSETSEYSNFVGHSAGWSCLLCPNSNYIGKNAGYGATGSSESNFMGFNAGNGATYAYGSNFFGYNAGNSSSAEYSNFFGSWAGMDQNDAAYSTFIGYRTGEGTVGRYLGSNNIIIGTNINLPENSSNAMSIGNVLYGTGFKYDPTDADSTQYISTLGKIGILVTDPTQQLHVNGNLRVEDAIYDSNNEPGTSGQILSSTVTGTDWIAAPDGDPQYLNPYVLSGDTVGFYLTVAVDTVLFVPTADTSSASIDSTIIIGGWGIDGTESPLNTWNLIADTSQVATQYDLAALGDNQTLTIDSTNRVFTIGITGGNTVKFKDTGGIDSTSVVNSYGTTITESPANQWNIKVDSSKFATTYDLTQVRIIDSTSVINSYGTIITESPNNQFNIKVDSSKFATTYDLTQVTGSSSKVIDILGSDFTTSATSLQSTALAYTFPSTGTYEVKVYGSYTCSNTANGLSIGWIDSGGLVASYITGKHSAFTNNGSSSSQEFRKPISAIGTTLITASVNASSTPYTLISETLITVSTTGTITYGFASGSGSYSATLQAGSSLIVEKLN